MPLSTTELRPRLDAAIQDEEAALARLQSLQAAAVAAGVEGSPEEAEAVSAHAKARTTVQRLRVALEHTQAAERAHLIALHRADEDAQERAALAAFDQLERASVAMEKNLLGYAKAWNALEAARTEAQRHVANFRPGVFRPDLRFMNPERCVKHALGALSATVPGRQTLPMSDNTGARLTAGDGTLATEIVSLVEAARQDLEKVRAARRPLPTPELVAEAWTV
jgi:hypothetical protein